MDLEASPVVCSVRKRCERVMHRVDRSLEYSLTDLAAAFPGDVGGYRYTIERASNSEVVGCLEGHHGRKADPVAEYCLFELSNGTKVEFVRWRESPEATAIVSDGRALGLCICTDLRRGWIFEHKGSWELEVAGAEFGDIRRGTMVTRDNLFILRPDGSRLPLILARQDRLRDFFLVFWRLLSFSFLYRPPPPNRDLIIPEGYGNGLSDDELLFYFAISLYFRASVFQLDYGNE